jgi:trypsin
VAQSKRGKTPNFLVELINNFSVFIQLIIPFSYGVAVQPIRMATIEPVPGAHSAVSGWGTLTTGGLLSSQLQAAVIYVTTRTHCNSAYAAYGGITDMICASVPGGSKDACQGDSGGPLVFVGQLFGIVFWGLSCALADYRGVYANVANLRSFVTEQSVVN